MDEQNTSPGIYEKIASLAEKHYSKKGIQPRQYAKHVANLAAIAGKSEVLDSMILSENIFSDSFDTYDPSLVMTKEQAIIEAAKCYSCKKEPCRYNGENPVCKSGNNIKEVLSLVMEGDFPSAYNILFKDNPTFELTCQGCRNGQSQQKYCQSNCTSGKTGININIPEINRAVAKYGAPENRLQPSAKREYKGTVVLVGAGPSSIRCAIELARTGIDAIVYEQSKNIGGVMVTEKPSFDQDMSVYERTIRIAEKEGVKFALNHKIDSQELNNLLNDSGIDAIYLGVGKTIPSFTSRVKVDGKSWHCENDSASGNMISNSKEFLKWFEKNKDEAAKLSVHFPFFIFDTGYTSVDIARTLAKERIDFRLLCYGGKTRMPEEEWMKRLNEVGFDFNKIILYNILPYELIIDPVKRPHMILYFNTNKAQKGLEFSESQIERHNAKIVPCSGIIHAEGSEFERTFEGIVSYANDNRIIVDEKCKTSHERIFAGGDAVTHQLNDMDLCSANATGRIAAKSIIEMINKND